MHVFLFLAAFMIASVLSFAQPANRYDVLIDEIMADPTPVVGLPNAEYIELKNKSGRTLNLQGWRIITSTGSSGPFAAYNLPADSFVVITSTSASASFATHGRVLGVSNFPALNNDGTTLALVSKEGKTIHAVEYSINWHNSAVKKEGGWSLEMIDSRYPCTGSANWKSSTALIGGTPGRKNSVDGIANDEMPPALYNAYLQDPTTLIVTFDEPLDSTSSVLLSNYSLSPVHAIVAAAAINPLLNSVQLKLAAPLQATTIYTLTTQNITDCSGNTIGSKNKIRIGIPQEAVALDVVINEILFNPKPDGYDYVEIYNRSQKIIDAAQLYLANRNNVGSIASVKKLTETPRYLFPGDYAVVTENSTSLAMQYFVQNMDAVLSVQSLPSFPDKEGMAVLVNLQGNAIDEVHYKEAWHFGLIANPEGVALERIDPEGPSQDAHNWHSAASTAGYGTPGYKNSQYKQGSGGTATINVRPKIFSPDNDGHDDITTIQYEIAESGYAGNIIIYDVAGRQVRHLVKNAILGLEDQWAWNGLDEKGQRLPVGIYIIHTELFNLQGKKQQFKNTVTLARKLK